MLTACWPLEYCLFTIGLAQIMGKCWPLLIAVDTKNKNAHAYNQSRSPEGQKENGWFVQCQNSIHKRPCCEANLYRPIHVGILVLDIQRVRIWSPQFLGEFLDTLIDVRDRIDTHHTRVCGWEEGLHLGNQTLSGSKHQQKIIFMGRAFTPSSLAFASSQSLLACIYSLFAINTKLS